MVGELPEADTGRQSKDDSEDSSASSSSDSDSESGDSSGDESSSGNEPIRQEDTREDGGEDDDEEDDDDDDEGKKRRTAYVSLTCSYIGNGGNDQASQDTLDLLSNDVAIVQPDDLNLAFLPDDSNVASLDTLTIPDPVITEPSHLTQTTTDLSCLEGDPEIDDTSNPTADSSDILQAEAELTVCKKNLRTQS